MTGIGKYIKCKNCEMGSLGGIEWLKNHQCPQPIKSRDLAQMVFLQSKFIGPVHPRLKATLVMSWRAGYLSFPGERRGA